MKTKNRFLLMIGTLSLFLLLSNLIYGQSGKNLLRDTITVNSKVIEFEDLPFLIDTIFLIRTLPEHQFVNFIFNRIKQEVEIDTNGVINKQVEIIYKILPIRKETHRKNIPQIRKDTLSNKQIITIKKTQTRNISDEIFGPGIERSGSISRGFSVGTNKDFTINSGLRLQLAGQLSNDVEIVAVLSDQSSPIQPEGNTRTLQEIDKVYIDLKHKFVQATFGDFQFSHRVGMFGLVDKKLQGIRTTALLNEKNSIIMSYASARGKFKSQQFNGIDGVQGPYRLTGENNERDIIILAGTEKVFINGEEKTRGENYDYTIDYSTGEIFFTPRTVITNSSRIKVDFEYSDRKFERNFFGSIINSNMFYDKIILGFSYFREGDNQDLPIDISLNEIDRKILAQSGNDRLRASKSGVKFVGYDSTGKPAGQYQLKDTLINGILYEYYEFNPLSDSAFYNVSFSYVGEGQGDYIRISLGRYRFVGPNNGNYLPIILLPMPELKQIGNFYSKFSLTKNLFVEGEFSLSSFDRNRFSSIGNEQNKGKAYFYKIGIDSVDIRIVKPLNGKLSINYYERKIDKYFSPISRIYEVEYERNWNINQSFINTGEVIREAQLMFFKDNFNSKISFGRMNRGPLFQSDRFIAEVTSSFLSKLNLNYQLSQLKSKALNSFSNYQKHYVNLNYIETVFTPYFKMEYENKQDRARVDSLVLSSFKFYDLTFGLTSGFIKYLDLYSSFNFRQDYFPLNNKLERESNSYIYQIALKLKNLKDLNSSLDLSLRQKKYSSDFKQVGRLNNQSLSIKFLGRGSFLERFFQSDVYYEVASQRSSKLERIFLRVARGTGQYIYKGDLNNNGIADEFEFEPTKFDGDYILTTYPTDQLFPVIDLKASLRIKLVFRNFMYFETVQKFLKPFSTETYFRIEENSQDKNELNLYLIRLKTFQNPINTIRGNNLIQQDIYLLEYNPDFNILFRMIERRGFSKYSLTDERRFNQEKIIRLRFKPLKEFANQSEVNLTRNNLISSNYSQRNFLIKQINFSSKIFYYPYNNIEAAFKIENGKAEDLFPQVPAILNSNSQEFSLIIMFSQRGKIAFVFERTEMILNQNLTYIPFELTRGYSIGKNYIWRLTADYQLANTIQTSIIYDGRIQGNNNPVHTATAEVKAYF